MAPLLASNLSANDERSPLLANPADPEGVVADSCSSASLRDESEGCKVPARVAKRLYVSHFLSTWNSRVFEFGAVLYLASIFPGTLLPMSVYALTRGTAAILFSPAVGQYIDTGNRLHVVRLSIGKPRLQLVYCIPRADTLGFSQDSHATTRCSRVMRCLLHLCHRFAPCSRRRYMPTGTSSALGMR